MATTVARSSVGICVIFWNRSSVWKLKPSSTRLMISAGSDKPESQQDDSGMSAATPRAVDPTDRRGLPHSRSSPHTLRFHRSPLHKPVCHMTD